MLRAFSPLDIPILEEAGADPSIPKITTVPATYIETAALAYIDGQHDRFRSGAGYSFAICVDKTCRYKRL
jgi:[ribosomal protein S5]-alanine N-acetyltransferase